MIEHKPTYPVYIPSRGRSETCLTARILQSEGIDFFLVVEPQDFQKYVAIYGPGRCLELSANDQGLWFARNFCKTHSMAKGDRRHWQLDDNIKNFRIREGRQNLKTQAGRCLSLAEFMTDRSRNIGISALRYSVFAFGCKDEISINQQCSSAVLVNNANGMSWRPGVVEDTDYSMQVLASGQCTLVFNRVLIEKAKTMTMKGGCTEIQYAGDGRRKFQLELQRLWPGTFELGIKEGRSYVRPSRVWRHFQQRPVPR